MGKRGYILIALYILISILLRVINKKILNLLNYILKVVSGLRNMFLGFYTYICRVSMFLFHYILTNTGYFEILISSLLF